MAVTDAGGSADLIAGRYRLVERLGSGSMGEVWRAHDERLDRTVAIKQLKNTSEIQQDDLSEARIAAKLHHPNAVTVHDVIEHDGHPCLVMSYVRGSALSGRGSLRPVPAARIGLQVAGALTAAHEVGIVHRDVKPDNVLLTDDGTAMLTDFGISRVVGDVSKANRGTITGTPAYLAPEVAAGGEASFASDVFSLGATLYAAVEGTAPFGFSDDTKALLHLVATGHVPEPVHAGPLGPVLMWMLRKEPGARPTMPQAAQALGAIADGRRVVPPTATLMMDGALIDAGGRRKPSGRTVAIALAGVGLAVLGLIVGISIGTGERPGTLATQPPTAHTRAIVPPHTQQAAADTNCVADYSLTNSWPGGYQAQVTVTAGDLAVNGWTVTLNLPDGQTITQLWGGALTHQGTSAQVASLTYNESMSANASTTFGFLGSVQADSPGTPQISCVAQQ